MCGRFALGVPHEEIQQLHGYNVQVGEWVAQEHFHPRYNVAPRSYAPVIRRGQRDRDAGEPEQVILHTMKWGLVPHWNKHDDGNLNTINARCEALVEGGGMWGSIKGRKRCAVPVQGYYEWLKKDKQRLPHFTTRGDGNLMLLAGLYDCVTLEGQTEPLWSFTIVTTDANKDFSWLHDRQPVILSSNDALNTWLDTSSGVWNAALTRLVQPYHDDDVSLTCFQVPKEVGKVGTESSTFVEPIATRKDGIQAMFARQLESPTSSQAVKRKRSASPTPTPSSSRGDNQRSTNKAHTGKAVKPSPKKKVKPADDDATPKITAFFGERAKANKDKH